MIQQARPLERPSTPPEVRGQDEGEEPKETPMSLAVVQSDPDVPFYLPIGQECALFEHAFRHRLPLLLKGPTGCGKTRFVAHMAARLGVPLLSLIHI